MLAKSFLKGIVESFLILGLAILALFPPELSGDQLKILIGLPLVAIFSYKLGYYINEREFSKRKKALYSGNCSKAHCDKNHKRSVPQ